MESALQESTPPSSDLFTAWELDNLTAEQLSDPAINQKARASLVALSKAKQEQKSSVYQDVREEDRLSPQLRKELDESLAADKVVDETLTENVVTTSVIDQTFGNEGGLDVIKKGNLDDLPDTAIKMFGKYDKAGWKGTVSGQTPGTAAGSKYLNKDGKLPMMDSAGNSLTYKEFDVNNKFPNANRDAQRFLKGSDGSIYYTNDHYSTFIKIK